jgi:hypothetical protein
VHPESWKPIVCSPPCQSMPDHASPYQVADTCLRVCVCY